MPAWEGILADLYIFAAFYDMQTSGIRTFGKGHSESSRYKIQDIRTFELTALHSTQFLAVLNCNSRPRRSKISLY